MSNRTPFIFAAATLFLSQGAMPLRAGEKVKIGGAVALALPADAADGWLQPEGGVGVGRRQDRAIGLGSDRCRAEVGRHGDGGA